MKKIFFLLIILTLVGCATQVENKNVVLKKGMTKSEVWTKFHNTTGMPSVVYVCIIALLTTLYGLSGYEAASQMSEETYNA